MHRDIFQVPRALFNPSRGQNVDLPVTFDARQHAMRDDHSSHGSPRLILALLFLQRCYKQSRFHFRFQTDGRASMPRRRRTHIYQHIGPILVTSDVLHGNNHASRAVEQRSELSKEDSSAPTLALITVSSPTANIRNALACRDCCQAEAGSTTEVSKETLT